MSKFHTTVSQWGLVSGIRQTHSDLIIVTAPRSPFARESRKGQLILVVEAEGDVARGRQACTTVAKTICETFYDDGSMSITASLRAALKAANAALYQHNFNAPPHKRALVGVTCAVIHGADLFMTQAPPAQAFVAHAAKVRALPMPLSWTNGADTTTINRQGALGTSLGSEPEFFRAVIQSGDTIVLCSSNVARLLSRHTAEQLIGYSDAATIAEALYDACRQASIPEAHAIVIEAVPGPAPADHAETLPPSPAQEPAPRSSGWFGRRVRRERQPQAASAATPSTPTSATALADAPSRTPQAMPTQAVAAPAGVFDTLPIADDVPLPPSAFIGEGEYGGLVRPPAVPKRNRAIDLSDNLGTPVDFAAIPRKPPVPPPSVSERLTMPLRALMAGLLGGLSNVPRRTARSTEQRPAQGLKLKGLSYRRQRPPLPWFNIFLIVGIVALLVAFGIQQNKKRDNTTVTVALDKVEATVRDATRATSDQTAQAKLAEAEAALNGDVQDLVQSGMITETKPLVWSRYLTVRRSYDRAMAAINRIGFVDNFRTVATLPGESSLIDRIVLGTTATITETPPLFYLDRGAGLLYQSGEAEPILKAEQQIGPFATGPVREILWREGNIIAFDRGDPIFPIYRVYLRSEADWLANQLNATEQMEPADGNLPMASFAGNLYIWDQKAKQLWKYSSGLYADLPAPWITNTGGAALDDIADMEIEGQVYMLKRDGSILVFEGGQLTRQIAAPVLTVPLATVERFTVTPDELEADGTTIKRPGYIYMLDTKNERILQLNKRDGTLIQQIQARRLGPLNKMTDLAVDETRQTIYLANGPSVLMASMPEPPQLTPGEAATATPEP